MPVATEAPADLTAQTRAAYDAIAPFYDAFTSHHDHRDWTYSLERLARGHGLTGSRLLDVGCGTGKSFVPFLERGWSVTGCDVSAEMLARARARTQGRARLVVRDVRRLGVLGCFDLAIALCDVVNYLDGRQDLIDAFACIRANLRPGGLALFDANTVHNYETFFASSDHREAGSQVVDWKGGVSPGFRPGDLAGGRFEGRDVNRGSPSSVSLLHRQRHHRPETITEAVAAAELQLIGIWGQHLDGRPERPPDESRHTKLVYLARKPEAIERR
jgi:SAM-dependent methyltransferase